jgi:RNA polymerase sigma factor (sigma-70 family)
MPQLSVSAPSPVPEEQFGALAERIRAGDARAESELVAALGRGVRIMLERRIADQELARDIWQDTFTVILMRLRNGTLDAPERLPAFVHQTATNLAVGAFRRDSRRRTHADSDALEQMADPLGNPYHALSHGERRSAIHRLIGEMTVPRDRQLLLRYYLDEIDKASLCAELDLSPDHFDRVLHRARNRLRELLLAQGASNWSPDE